MDRWFSGSWTIRTWSTGISIMWCGEMTIALRPAA
jgi:hypothetical protein